MSLDLLQRLFRELPSLTQRELRLVRFVNDPSDGMNYTSRAISLYSDTDMNKLLEDIKDAYIEEDGKKERGRLRQYTTVDEYDGSLVGTTIYSLDSTNDLIGTAFNQLGNSLDKPQSEIDPFEFGANAYALQGVWTRKGRAVPVKLIAVWNPFKTLKHKFAYEKGVFKEISQKVLDLRLYSDVVVIGPKVYFFGMAGEKLFGMERAYRTNAEKLAEKFSKVPFLTNAEQLRTSALSGHYPRMLVSYQPSKMEHLKTVTHRRAIAKKFGIAIKPNGNFDTETPESAERLIRFLCNKGMLDPTNQNAMEVTGAKRWVC